MKTPKIKNSFSQIFGILRNSGLLKATAGFVAFLIIAAAVMQLVESRESESGINDFFHSLWFSIVTVTTVGYGDLSPLSKIGKIAAVIIMFIGIGYSGILTGNITSWLVGRNVKKEKGLVPLKGLKKHLIICGWKNNMALLVKEIMQAHGKAANQIVLLNEGDSQEINELRQSPLLRGLHFFSGDYTNREILKKVCLDGADRLLVLADESSEKSYDEKDFYTVLATIAIARGNPSIHLSVEIIQPKFQTYLQHVKVNEIVLNHFNARALMCNITLVSGLHSVYQSLFHQKWGCLKVIPIPPAFIGKSYQELRTQLQDVFLLGLLENTGDLNKRKREKMEQVQKSPSIAEAIQGLKELKKMKSNLPVLNPNPGYIIQENSTAIILGRQATTLVALQDEILQKKHQPVEVMPRLSGLLLICGWKNSMYEMLDFLLQQQENQTLRWSRIQVVAKVGQEIIEEFAQYFKDDVQVGLYPGDYVEQEVLLAAGIKNATKVVILAETDSNRTNEEIDAQTVLSAMVISNCNKRAYKVAEILDRRYKDALEQANVEEIVLMDEFFRTMLADATLGKGLSQVLKKMLNLKQTQFEIAYIRHEFVGRPFRSLLEHSSVPGELVLGVLEDTGNLYVRKSKMIQQAKVQPKIFDSVAALSKVKKLFPNKVVLTPPLDYLVLEHSRLIILKTTDNNGWKSYTKS